MGDPRHTPGASYNVGTSTAPGVSKTLLFLLIHLYMHDEIGVNVDVVFSLILDLQVRHVLFMQAGSNLIAMRVIRIARMGTTRLRTRGMGRSMGRLLLHL
jgi:hypothetical protein